MPLPDCACGGYPYFRSRYPGFEAECKDCGQHIHGDTKLDILTKWNSPLSIQHLSTNEKIEMTSPEPRNYSEIVYADMTATADSLAFNAAMSVINEAIAANHYEYYYFCNPRVSTNIKTLIASMP